ncbi:helix-turn-helix domain-containing protein [Actinokineospora guangxiensis]|uniref:Helix-turn-helix domain-containing protein n=1 Tax=Actinokineospora guangxiensis TaxID=1490288 RepID=A0ABW0ELJ4_9PSEU
MVVVVAAPRGRDGFEPWRDIPAVAARVLRPRIDAIACELVETIRTEVGGYRAAPNTDVGRDVLAAVRRAVAQFVSLIENPVAPSSDDVEFFRRLGRTEYRNGRELDDLQAAYRVGARVACRRYAQIAQAAALPMTTVLSISDAVLAHIDNLANESAKGYAEAKSHGVDDPGRRRRALVERLVRRNPPEVGPSTAELAERAGWAVPDALACLVVDDPGGGRFRFDPDVLLLERAGELTAVIPGPRVAAACAAVGGARAAVGPVLPVAETWLSRYCARLALRTLPRSPEVIAADQHLLELFLRAGEPLGALLGRRGVDRLAELGAGKAARLAETLAALLASWGRSAPEIAAELGIHPQTARYRLRQLDEVFGDRMGDPDFRYEAETVLRLRALRRRG